MNVIYILSALLLISMYFNFKLCESLTEGINREDEDDDYNLMELKNELRQALSDLDDAKEELKKVSYPNYVDIRDNH